MESVASQLIEEVTAHEQSDSLEDALEKCADGNLRTYSTSTVFCIKDSQLCFLLLFPYHPWYFGSDKTSWKSCSPYAISFLIQNLLSFAYFTFRSSSFLLENMNVITVGIAECNANITLLFLWKNANLRIVSKSFVLGNPAHDWKEVIIPQSERIFCVVLTEELNLICPYWQAAVCIQFIAILYQCIIVRFCDCFCLGL